MKKIILLSLLFFSSCAIEEIARQPIMTPPLGLTVSRVKLSGNGFAMYFTSINEEIFFTGYAIYVSPQEKDFAVDPNVIFPVRPTDIPGSKAQLLTNYENADDTNMSIFVGGAMSFPNLWIYPKDAVYTDTQRPKFTSTTFTTLPNGDPFVIGTTYYFVAYAYSTVDNAYSLPSNIASAKFD